MLQRRSRPQLIDRKIEEPIEVRVESVVDAVGAVDAAVDAVDVVDVNVGGGGSSGCSCRGSGCVDERRRITEVQIVRMGERHWRIGRHGGGGGSGGGSGGVRR